jgi:hypothetical protein
MTGAREPTRRSALLRLSAAIAVLAGTQAARAASIAVEGGAIVLGKTRSASVLIRVDEPAGSEVRPLRLSVNVGQFSEPVRLGPGKYRATYTPPEAQFPQVALVAVWRETGPDARIDFLRVPLFGRTRVRLAAPPRSEVRADVGIDHFGPAFADRAGRAEIPLHVEPGVRDCGVVVKDGAGQEVTRRVKVEVPPYNRLTAALVPHAVLADGKSAVRVDVYYDLAGAQVAAELLRVSPSIGSVTFERAARGVYTYRYLPPPETPATTVTFDVSVVGDPVARAGAKLALGLPPPARLVVTGPAARLRAGTGARGTVSVLVLDGAGMGLPGLDVTATAAGSSLPPPAYRGGGRYEFTLDAPASYPPGGTVAIRARAAGAGAAVDGSLDLPLDPPPLPAAAAWRVEPSPVPADGHTEARVVLELRDAAGLPLEHAQLVAVATHGTVGAVRERGGGVYEQTYVAPPALPDVDPELRVADATGGFERRLPVPLRAAARRLSAGAGGGYTLASGAASGARLLVDAWAPVAGRVGAGLAVAYGTAATTVSDVGGALSSRATTRFVPLSLKLGWDAYLGRRLSVTVGGGASVAWAEFRSSLSSALPRGFGLGAMGFADLGWRAGAGQVVLGVSYGTVPIETSGYRVDPGGLSGTLAYRVGLL